MYNELASLPGPKNDYVSHAPMSMLSSSPGSRGPVVSQHQHSLTKLHGYQLYFL